MDRSTAWVKQLLLWGLTGWYWQELQFSGAGMKYTWHTSACIQLGTGWGTSDSQIACTALIVNLPLKMAFVQLFPPNHHAIHLVRVCQWFGNIQQNIWDQLLFLFLTWREFWCLAKLLIKREMAVRSVSGIVAIDGSYSCALLRAGHATSTILTHTPLHISTQAAHTPQAQDSEAMGAHPGCSLPVLYCLLSSPVKSHLRVTIL